MILQMKCKMLSLTVKSTNDLGRSRDKGLSGDGDFLGCSIYIFWEKFVLLKLWHVPTAHDTGSIQFSNTSKQKSTFSY